jgi:hypothetical protein
MLFDEKESNRWKSPELSKNASIPKKVRWHEIFVPCFYIKQAYVRAGLDYLFFTFGKNYPADVVSKKKNMSGSPEFFWKTLKNTELTQDCFHARLY